MNSHDPNALTPDDYKILLLGLGLLTKHTDVELANARKHNNNGKQLALRLMQSQISMVRSKIVNRRGAL